MIKPEIIVTVLMNIVEVQSNIISIGNDIENIFESEIFININVFSLICSILSAMKIIDIIRIIDDVMLIIEIVVPQTIVFIKLEL